MAYDVQPQNVTVLSGKGLQLIDSTMGAFADPVGVTVRVEPGFKQRLNDVAQGVVDDPISEWGRTDFASFGFMDGEVLVCARLVHGIF